MAQTNQVNSLCFFYMSYYRFSPSLYVSRVFGNELSLSAPICPETYLSHIVTLAEVCPCRDGNVRLIWLA